MSSPKQLKLTEAQSAQLKAEFGHPVGELHFSVEEFPIKGAAQSTMKVLKVSNVAHVLSAGTTSTVN